MTTAGLVRRPYDVVAEMITRGTPALKALLSPMGMSAERHARVALDALTRNPLLLQCEPASIARSVFYAADLGLEVGGPLGEAYFVPFWNSKKQRKECQCIPGYRGLVSLAYDDPRIVGVYGEVVRERDVFAEHRGTKPELVHNVDRLTDRGGPVAAYGCVQIRDGWPVFRVLAGDDVLKLKQASLAKLKDEWQRNASPWVAHEEEMWIKSGLRRVLKVVPLSSRLRRALDLDAQEYGEKPTRQGNQELRQKMGGTVEAVDAEVIEDDEVST